MSTEATEEFERKCRALFESTHDRAIHNDAVAKDQPLGIPASRFLADYERIAALSGQEFCTAALDAVQRLDDDTQAEYQRYREQNAQRTRKIFEDFYEISVGVRKAQDDFYSNIAKTGETREPSPMGKRFREQAEVFLADADRIRALTGEDFIREAEAALDPFKDIDMKAVKAEIHADWAATPLLRRWRRKPR